MPRPGFIRKVPGDLAYDPLTGTFGTAQDSAATSNARRASNLKHAQQRLKTTKATSRTRANLMRSPSESNRNATNTTKRPVTSSSATREREWNSKATPKPSHYAYQSYRAHSKYNSTGGGPVRAGLNTNLHRSKRNNNNNNNNSARRSLSSNSSNSPGSATRNANTIALYPTAASLSRDSPLSDSGVTSDARSRKTKHSPSNSDSIVQPSPISASHISAVGEGSTSDRWATKNNLPAGKQKQIAVDNQLHRGRPSHTHSDKQVGYRNTDKQAGRAKQKQHQQQQQTRSYGATSYNRPSTASSSRYKGQSASNTKSLIDKNAALRRQLDLLRQQRQNSNEGHPLGVTELPSPASIQTPSTTTNKLHKVHQTPDDRSTYSGYYHHDKTKGNGLLVVAPRPPPPVMFWGADQQEQTRPSTAPSQVHQINARQQQEDAKYENVTLRNQRVPSYIEHDVEILTLPNESVSDETKTIVSITTEICGLKKEREAPLKSISTASSGSSERGVPELPSYPALDQLRGKQQPESVFGLASTQGSQNSRTKEGSFKLKFSGSHVETNGSSQGLNTGKQGGGVDKSKPYTTIALGIVTPLVKTTNGNGSISSGTSGTKIESLSAGETKNENKTEMIQTAQNAVTSVAKLTTASSSPSSSSSSSSSSVSLVSKHHQSSLTIRPKTADGSTNRGNMHVPLGNFFQNLQATSKSRAQLIAQKLPNKTKSTRTNGEDSLSSVNSKSGIGAATITKVTTGATVAVLGGSLRSNSSQASTPSRRAAQGSGFSIRNTLRPATAKSRTNTRFEFGSETADGERQTVGTTTTTTTTSKVKQNGTRQRPASARAATIQNVSDHHAKLFSSNNSRSVKKSNQPGTASQESERQRLRKIVSSPEWNGAGQADMYVFGKLLGQGTFGTVRLAHHKITGHKVAVKTYEKARMKDPGQFKRCRQEIYLMQRLNHANIVVLFETFESPKRIHLVMEAATGGNLCNYVKKHKSLSEGEALRILHQLTSAVEYLHANRIVHRDIKLENVLFDSHRNMKLVDFGFSVAVGDKPLKVFCGTPSYMAPEIVRRKEYKGLPVDIWSLGVLLYAMLCGCFPFTAKTYPELYKTILRGHFHIPDRLTAYMRDVLRRMLCLDSDKRLTVRQLRQHPLLVNAKLPAAPHHDDCLQLISTRPDKDIKPPLLKQLAAFGFNYNSIEQAVLHRKKNHMTSTYYLLCMKAGKKKERQDLQKKKTENQEAIQKLQMQNFQQLQVTNGSVTSDTARPHTADPGVHAEDDEGKQSSTSKISASTSQISRSASKTSIRTAAESKTGEEDEEALSIANRRAVYAIRPGTAPVTQDEVGVMGGGAVRETGIVDIPTGNGDVDHGFSDYTNGMGGEGKGIDDGDSE